MSPLFRSKVREVRRRRSSEKLRYTTGPRKLCFTARCTIHSPEAASAQSRVVKGRDPSPCSPGRPTLRIHPLRSRRAKRPGAAPPAKLNTHTKYVAPVDTYQASGQERMKKLHTRARREGGGAEAITSTTAPATAFPPTPPRPSYTANKAHPNAINNKPWRP